MRRLLLLSAAVAAVAASTPAYATLGSCVSVDQECWDHQCEPGAVVDRRIEAQDTGPIVHICV